MYHNIIRKKCLFVKGLQPLPLALPAKIWYDTNGKGGGKVEHEQFVAVPGMTFILANKSYSGSRKGMRYNIRVTEEGFAACVWPDPWCYEKTAETEKIHEIFSRDEQGLEAAQRWIEAQYYADPGRWPAKNFLEV